MVGTSAVKRGECPKCHQAVIVSAAPGVPETFEPGHMRMLVILSFPEIDGKKRVALGPCQDDPRPLHREGEEPVVYFGHVRHRCPDVSEMGPFR